MFNGSTDLCPTHALEATRSTHAQIEDICERCPNPVVRMVELTRLRKKVETVYRQAGFHYRLQEAAFAHLLVKIEEAEMEALSEVRNDPRTAGDNNSQGRGMTDTLPIPMIDTDTGDDDGDDVVSPDTPHSPEPRAPLSEEEPRLERQHARIWTSSEMAQREPSEMMLESVTMVLDFNEKEN